MKEPSGRLFSGLGPGAPGLIERSYRAGDCPLTNRGRFASRSGGAARFVKGWVPIGDTYQPVEKKAGGPPFSIASPFMSDTERSLIPGASPRSFTPLSWYDCRKGRRLPLGLSARANETR